jgi:hypothetical protein
MIPGDGRFAVGLLVFLDERRIALAHGIDGNVGVADLESDHGRAGSFDELRGRQ